MLLTNAKYREMCVFAHRRRGTTDSQRSCTISINPAINKEDRTHHSAVHPGGSWLSWDAISKSWNATKIVCRVSNGANFERSSNLYPAESTKSEKCRDFRVASVPKCLKKIFSSQDEMHLEKLRRLWVLGNKHSTNLLRTVRLPVHLGEVGGWPSNASGFAGQPVITRTNSVRF